LRQGLLFGVKQPHTTRVGKGSWWTHFGH